MVVDRKPENETEDYFSHELSPYPMSLFKDGAMRPAAKSKLKNSLSKDVPPSEPLPGTFKTIADGGAFLWCCKWKQNDLFGDIFKKYVDAVKKFGKDVVVFDGYAVPTKDCTHQKRTGKVLNVVDICDDNPYSSDQELFFANYSNKEKFISELARKLEDEGVNVVMCSRDADTTIVKVALQIKDASALVFTDDTDNLCLLIHHVDTSQKQNNIYIKNMTKKKESNERLCYRLHDVIDNLDPLIYQVHSVCSCLHRQ